MHRRHFLGLSAAAMGSLAGCATGWQADHDTDAVGPGPAPDPPVAADVDLPVPRSELESRLARDGIPAVVDPEFAEDWSGLPPDGVDDPSLPGEAAVVGVERAGGARAYPLRVLDWHEVVNDEFGGPITVTYCPLCGSSVVVERRFDGEPTTFGVSGMLWRGDLVMYDEATESLWSQLLATATRGPRTGSRLALLPSTLTTWREWRRAHPGTEVLLPPPRSSTVRGSDATFPYYRNKYAYEDQDQLVGFDGDGELGDRTMVLGITDGDVSRAYPFDVVADEGVVNDVVGELPVVVTVAPDDTLVAYERRVGGRTRGFEAAGERYLEAAGSRFDRTTGRAVDGPHAGQRLERANEHPPVFWRGWRNFTQETTVYGSQPDG